MSQLTRRPRCGGCSAIVASHNSNFAVRYNYILDFVCLDQRLVVEVDGSQHASAADDASREAVLVREGFRIARYWNNDVLQQRTAVLEDILAKLCTR